MQLQTIGAEEGDIIVFEKTKYEETPFELPPLGDKMNNLVRFPLRLAQLILVFSVQIRSIVVKTDPQEKLLENLRAAKCRDDYTKLKSDKHVRNIDFFKIKVNSFSTWLNTRS